MVVVSTDTGSAVVLSSVVDSAVVLLSVVMVDSLGNDVVVTTSVVPVLKFVLL